MELKLVGVAKVSGNILMEESKELLGKVDELGCQAVRTTTATIVDLVRGESSLANTGAKVAGTGIAIKIGASLVEGALGAVGVDVSLSTAHTIGDTLIGGGVVVAGAGVLATAYGNRNITDEQLIKLSKNTVTDTPSDKKEDVIDIAV